MDELELLKRDWQKKDEHLPKLSFDEIYTMIWKKSSSIVKWIFYISIVELVFWIVINSLPLFSESYQELFSKYDLGYSKVFMISSTIIAFAVILVFIYFLYKSYKEISVVNDVKALMESILKTRTIVKYYVIYNIIVMFLASVYGLYFAFTKDEQFLKVFETAKNADSELKFYLIIGVFFLLCLVATVGFIWLFYHLIYGLLLKKLNLNYKELKRLEV